MNTLKTTVLLALLTALFMGIGLLLGGEGGMVIALIFSVGLNFSMYWFSDKLILKAYRAEELSEEEAPEIHRVVSNLAEKASIPKPQVYMIPDKMPNAFATGRNPRHAAVAVTKGLTQILDSNELEAVLAHEISHVINRDTLISVIAASLAGAISMLAVMARWGAIFGGRRRRGGNIFVVLALSIIAPLAAAVIQMAISRGREYKADRGAGELTGRPMALASALKKLEAQNHREAQQPTQQATAHMFIVNPFSSSGRQRAPRQRSSSNLFSTHPPVQKRVEELEKMARGL